MRRPACLLAVLALGLTAPAAAPRWAVAPAHARVEAPVVVPDSSALLARGGFGRGLGGRSFGRSRPRTYPYRGVRRPSPFSRRGRGFFHGLFWGFLLGHWFSGGGFPVFLILLPLMFLLVAGRRRRRRAR